jgi:alpha-tubulin suppressor-like RCC1 family protein
VIDTKIYSTECAFAALKADGSITAWGNSDDGGTGAPSDNGYTKIYSAGYAFAALKADGSITTWGNSDEGGTGAPIPIHGVTNNFSVDRCRYIRITPRRD